MNRFTCCGWAALVLFVSCAREGGNSGAEGSRAPCPETEVPLAGLDAVDEELSFSPNDVLDLTRMREVAMRWDARDSGPSLKVGEETLTLIVEPSSSNAAVFRCDDPYYKGVDRPAPRLEIPVTLTLSTADGTLDERFDTVLVATEATRATIGTITVEPEELQGGLGQAVAAFYTGGTRSLIFDLTFTEEGPAGWIGGPFSPHRSTPCAYTAYATWPANAECWHETQAEPTDRNALQVHLDRANGVYQLHWDTGQIPDATLEVELADGPTCRSGQSVDHRADVRITTADGRLDLTLPGWLHGGAPEPGPAPPPFALDLSAAIALDAEALREALDYSSSDVSAAIVSMYVATPAVYVATPEEFGDPMLSGMFRAVAIDRTGFDTALPIVQLPGGDSERCFDSRGIGRAPLLAGRLVLK